MAGMENSGGRQKKGKGRGKGMQVEQKQLPSYEDVDLSKTKPEEKKAEKEESKSASKDVIKLAGMIRKMAIENQWEMPTQMQQLLMDEQPVEQQMQRALNGVRKQQRKVGKIEKTMDNHKAQVGGLPKEHREHLIAEHKKFKETMTELHKRLEEAKGEESLAQLELKALTIQRQEKESKVDGAEMDKDAYPATR